MKSEMLRLDECIAERSGASRGQGRRSRRSGDYGLKGIALLGVRRLAAYPPAFPRVARYSSLTGTVLVSSRALAGGGGYM